MRGIALLVGFGALAACTMGPEQATRTPEGQRQFEQLVAGKVPGPPVHCLPSFDMNDMVIIDESTVAYRLGGNRVYINNMQGTCNGLGRNATMVTQTIGNTDTCRGDIARMIDQGSRMMSGSCAFGDFVPYTRPR
jgi:hypothetical protein